MCSTNKGLITSLNCCNLYFWNIYLSPLLHICRFEVVAMQLIAVNGKLIDLMIDYSQIMANLLNTAKPLYLYILYINWRWPHQQQYYDKLRCATAAITNNADMMIKYVILQLKQSHILSLSLFLALLPYLLVLYYMFTLCGISSGLVCQ